MIRFNTIRDSANLIEEAANLAGPMFIVWSADSLTSRDTVGINNVVYLAKSFDMEDQRRLYTSLASGPLQRKVVILIDDNPNDLSIAGFFAADNAITLVPIRVPSDIDPDLIHEGYDTPEQLAIKKAQQIAELLAKKILSILLDPSNQLVKDIDIVIDRLAVICDFRFEMYGVFNGNYLVEALKTHLEKLTSAP